ncbi:MAG: hypothetical protein K6F83_05610 [Clostridiales bacterium]|nr:hypothetical protein [Clostridiales bacterium]
MDEVKKEAKTYVEYLADKELEEEESLPSVESKEVSTGGRFIRSLAHFWTYNKWKIIVGLISVVVIGCFIFYFVQNNKKRCFTVALVNSQIDGDFDKVIGGFDSRVKEKGHYDSTFETTVIDRYMHYLRDVETPTYDESLTASMQRLSHEIMSDMIDVLIVNTRCADEYNNSGAVKPLDEILTKEELESLSEEDLYYRDGKAIGIRIDRFKDKTDTLVFREGDDYILIVSNFSSRKELCREFVLYMIGD